MLDDRFADRHTVAGDDVEDSGRQDLRLHGELEEAQRRQRRLLGRLQHLRVPRGQRGRELPDGHHQGVVPGGDPADHAERLTPEHRRVAAHVLAGGLALEHPRRAGEEANVVGGDRHLVARGRQRLADVLGLELGQLLGVFVEQVGELEQDLRALRGRRLEPFGQSLLRRLDGAVGVLLRAAGDLGDRLAGCRVQHLHRLAGGRVDPLTADDVFVVRDRHAHECPPSLTAFKPTPRRHRSLPPRPSTQPRRGGEPRYRRSSAARS